LPQIFPESTAAFFQFSAAQRASPGDPTSIGALSLSMAEKRIMPSSDKGRLLSYQVV